MIRKNLFETNSSSSHSFSISGDEIDPTGVSHLINGNTLTIAAGEFGWGVEIYWDAETKLSYLATYIQQQEIDCDALDLLIEAINFQLPSTMSIDKIEIVGSGYIDHQSYYVPEEIFNLGAAKVSQFIFSKKSILCIDNDNH